MYEPYNSGFHQMDPRDQYRGNNSMHRPMDPAMRPQNRPPPAMYNQPHQENEYHRSGLPTTQHSSSSNSIFPRSASEALFDTTTKFRQLPCRTFISVGTCPYRERCVYLHDPRCICKEAKTKTRRKNKEDVVLDALFWPVMPYPMVAAKLDMNRQPHVIQSYSVPLPQPDQYHNHDAAVYSLWMHFVDFCMATAESVHARNPDAATCYCAPDLPVNGYTDTARLQIFRFLSSCNGRAIGREELLRASSVGMPAYARQVQIPMAPVPAPPRRPVQQAQGYQEEVNPYFMSSEAPLHGMYDPTSRGVYSSDRPGAAQGPAAARPQDPFADRYAPRPASLYDAGANFGGNASFPAQPQAGADRESALRARAAAPAISSPVTVAEDRSPHHPLSQQQARGALGTIGAKTSPAGTADATPTSLSLLMNTVPQSTLRGAVVQKLDLNLPQPDPWGLEGYGATTDDERDSGSSLASDMPHDFQAIWRGGLSGSSSKSDDTANTNFFSQHQDADSIFSH